MRIATIFVRRRRLITSGSGPSGWSRSCRRQERGPGRHWRRQNGEASQVLAKDDRPVKERRVSQRKAEIDERVAPVTSEHQRQAHEQQVQDRGTAGECAHARTSPRRCVPFPRSTDRRALGSGRAWSRTCTSRACASSPGRSGSTSEIIAAAQVDLSIHERCRFSQTAGFTHNGKGGQ